MTKPTRPERVEHRMERTYEVQATPEEVWQAIATAEGISTWLAPTRLDPRVGGELVLEFGEFTSIGVVTDYTPNRRLAYEEPWPAEEHMATRQHDMSTVSPIATEFLIESASGGSCVLRVVSSAFGTGAEWEKEFFDEMIEGWIPMLDALASQLGPVAATP